MIKMTEIAKLANEKFDNDVENVKAELKRVQSVKCRLKKQKAKSTYDVEMAEVVAYEQVLKEVRDYIVPKKLTVTTMSADDIATLTYDETIKAIKSIQSKKCNTQFLTADINENVEYQEAVRIEKMLLEHKATIKPHENAVSKSNINDLIHQIENQKDVDKEYVLELLKKLQSN